VDSARTRHRDPWKVAAEMEDKSGAFRNGAKRQYKVPQRDHLSGDIREAGASQRSQKGGREGAPYDLRLADDSDSDATRGFESLTDPDDFRQGYSQCFPGASPEGRAFEICAKLKRRRSNDCQRGSRDPITIPRHGYWDS